MDSIITVLLVVALIKFVIFGVILFLVFRPDLRKMRAKRKPAGSPACVYCQSKWTHALDEGQTRWDGDDLVLVTTYECQHCQLPFWHVERVRASSLKR